MFFMKLMREVVKGGRESCGFLVISEGVAHAQTTRKPQTVATSVISLTSVSLLNSALTEQCSVDLLLTTNYGPDHYVNKITDDRHNFC